MAFAGGGLLVIIAGIVLIGLYLIGILDYGIQKADREWAQPKLEEEERRRRLKRIRQKYEKKGDKDA